MIFWIISLILTLLIILTLLCPLPFSVNVDYSEKLDVSFKILGKKTFPAKQRKKAPIKIGFKEILCILFEEKNKVWGTIKYIIRKTVIKKLNLNVTVAGEDAAQTAITYGSVCSLLYPAVAFLKGITTVKKDNISLLCDFEKASPEINFFLDGKISYIYLLVAAFKILPVIKKIVKEVKNNEQNS